MWTKRATNVCRKIMERRKRKQGSHLVERLTGNDKMLGRGVGAYEAFSSRGYYRHAVRNNIISITVNVLSSYAWNRS